MKAPMMSTVLLSRLQSISEHARLAQGMSHEDDNLLELVDLIEADVQAVIEAINYLRRDEKVM